MSEKVVAYLDPDHVILREELVDGSQGLAAVLIQAVETLLGDPALHEATAFIHVDQREALDDG